jgi:Transposase
MLGFRLPISLEDRLEWWRRQICRQQAANLSVAEFCRQLGVSVTTFYCWKRRVEQPRRIAPGRRTAEHPSPHPTASAIAAVVNFVPVSILDLGADAQLEIELPYVWGHLT